MSRVEKFIRPLIEKQFPDFYVEDGDAFIDFVEAYYEWLDSEGSESRNILDYTDIDSTVDDFLIHFRNQYLKSFPLSSPSDVRFIIKHIQDLYKSKGSNQSYKLLFRILFNEDIDVYDPGNDVLRASDGVWKIPRYFECSRSDRTFSFVGKIIRGSTSGASAFVENVVRRKIKGKIIDIVYVNNIKGNFEVNENISDDGVIENSPKILGSLSEINITYGGSNNKIGDAFDVFGDNGKSAKAIVKEVSTGSSKVSFNLMDGGYGFTTNSSVLVSNVIISITGSNATFTPLATVEQPLVKIQYNQLSNNSLTPFTKVIGYNAANTAIANGVVLEITQANTTSGNVVISDTSGSWNVVSRIRPQSNLSITANATSISDITMSGSVVGSNANYVGLYSVTNQAYANAYIREVYTGPIGLSTTTTSSATLTGTNTQFQSIVSSGDVIFVRANNAYVGTVSTVTNNTSITLTTNAAIAISNTTLWHKTTVSTVNTGVVYSSGQNAGFKVGSITRPTTVTINTDLLSANNSGNIPFMDMLISGTNSNVASNAYGFPANVAASYNSVIQNALSNTSLTIGEILSLSSINPGDNYLASPFISVIEKPIAAYEFEDYVIDVSNTNNLFVSGQELRQSVNTTHRVLNKGVVNGTFIIGEGVQQNTTNATGIVISSNSTVLVVNPVSGTLTSGQTVIGKTSNANTTVTGISNTVSTSIAKGMIRSISGNSMVVKRMTLDIPFVKSNTDIVYSVDDNANVRGTGIISNIYTTDEFRYSGFNATVDSTVRPASGIATRLELLTSGFSYSNGDLLTLNHQDNNREMLNGEAILSSVGKGDGFWKNNNGKINSDKYLHDNNYYQDFSYEIRSSYSLDTYSEILKSLLHVSGTKMFGGTYIQSETDYRIDAANTQIEI